MRGFHVIELTSHCNLKCIYCPNPKFALPGWRVRHDMTDMTFGRVLAWLDFFVDRGTQIDELHLAGTGESTLHPKLCDYAAELRRRYSWMHLLLSTNGLLMTDALAAQLAQARVEVMVSMHKPVAAAKAIEIARQHGILKHAAQPASAAPHDWAGQVDWIKPAYRMPCTWLHRQVGFVAADGNILTCCFDATGGSKIGHVDEEPRSLEMKRWSICTNCNQDAP